MINKFNKDDTYVNTIMVELWTSTKCDSDLYNCDETCPNQALLAI